MVYILVLNAIFDTVNCEYKYHIVTYRHSPLRTAEVADRLGVRSMQLWIRSAEPPGEHRYENWTKNKQKTLSDKYWLGSLSRFHIRCKLKVSSMDFLSECTVLAK